MDLPVRVLGHTPPPPLPGVRQWWGNDEADNGLYLRHGMGLTPAAVMAELFTPAFVEVRGCVLLRHRFSERNFLTWWDKLDGDVIQIESVLNHTHLWDLMPEPTDDADEGILDWIGERLAEAWLDRVSRLFPQRRFYCELVDDYGPTISLHQAG